MEMLHDVLGRGAHDLAHLVADRTGLTEERAEQFVALAGSDLIDSIEWHADELEGLALSEPSNVRNLLGTIHAKRIASSLEIAPADVWAGLRAFVPQFLQLADLLRARAC
jgi:hypothetical protein